MENGQDLLPIKAFAEASGRSQQTIYKQIETRLAPYLHKIEGKKYIERRALKEVFELEVEQSSQPEKDNSFNPENNPEHPLYAILKAELDAKNKQIEQLQKDLETERQHSREQADKLAELAKGAQQLHAGSIMQQLEAGSPAHGEECAIDAEAVEQPPADLQEPVLQEEADPEQKLSFVERWKKAFSILKGE